MRRVSVSTHGRMRDPLILSRRSLPAAYTSPAPPHLSPLMMNPFSASSSASVGQRPSGAPSVGQMS